MLTFEYKAVLKKSQILAIEEAIRTSKFIRNSVLRYWMDNRGIGKNEMSKYLTQLRAEYPFVEDLNRNASIASIENVERAINRFYANCKNPKIRKKGYPKFKKKARSVEYMTLGWKLHPTKRRITFIDKKGIGELKLLGSWDIHTFDIITIKRVRIVRRADGYYVQFVVKVDNIPSAPPSESEVGIDVGLEYFYSDSNGNHEENPRFYRKAEIGIKRAQRQLSKRVKGSSGWKKARNKLSRRHLKVSRQRNEHAKRLARNLVLANAKVVLEDLNISNMVKNHKLAKSIHDAGWYQFRRWLEYFGKKFGREIIAVPPHYTSQECSSCGAIAKKSLSTRTHSCTSCGYVAQRDVNAAKVILNRRDGQSRTNASGVDTSTSTGRKTGGGK